jgi:hypothetical protein
MKNICYYLIMKQNIKKKNSNEEMRNESTDNQFVKGYQQKSENYLQTVMARLASIEQLKTKLYPNSTCTIINLSITPNSESIRLYRLSEIEKLVGIFINSKKINLTDNLENNPTWVQTYFTREEFHVIPVLNIQIIVNGKMDELSCDEIFSTSLDFYIDDVFISNYIEFVEVNDLINNFDLCGTNLFNPPIFDFNTFQGTILENYIKDSQQIKELDRILKNGIIQLKDEMIDKKSGSINFLKELRVISN